MSEMTLSEAIRLGAMQSPQAFETLHDTASGATCAMGAAANAIGCLGEPRFHSSWSAFAERWPIVNVAIDCPECQFPGWVVGCVVTHLNDEHRWTREQIADWVETLESAGHLAHEDARTDPAVAGDALVTSGSPVRV